MQLCKDNGLKRPQCYTRKKQGSRYPVKDTQAPSGLVFLKDCLAITNDEVFNLLVDTSHINTVVIGKDKEVANFFGKPLAKVAGITKGIGYTDSNDLYK